MKKEDNNQRRSFLMKVASLTVAGASVGSLVNRIVSRKKIEPTSSETVTYPKINTLAVARKKDKA